MGRVISVSDIGACNEHSFSLDRQKAIVSVALLSGF